MHKMLQTDFGFWDFFFRFFEDFVKILKFDISPICLFRSTPKWIYSYWDSIVTKCCRQNFQIYKKKISANLAKIAQNGFSSMAPFLVCRTIPVGHIALCKFFQGRISTIFLEFRHFLRILRKLPKMV